MSYQYDLFISYSTKDQAIANYLVEKIEKRGYKCFISPRDIKSGAEYANEIIKGISNSAVVLLVFSKESDKSHYVLREINSAVSRNKTVIPIRVEDFLPSEAMEFYLGPTHWLDAFPDILDIHLDKIINIFSTINNNVSASTVKEIKYKNPTLIKLNEISNIGLDYDDLTMKEIEIDYLCVPSEKYVMNDEIEGTFDEWKYSVKNSDQEDSILLVENDEIIGYCDVYPVIPEAYKKIITGEVIIRDSMTDLTCFGGEFDYYLPLIAIVPDHESQNNYMLLFKWVFSHLLNLSNNGIVPKNIGTSVYSDMLEKFIVKFGFEYKCDNPAKGKVYETTFEKLICNPLVEKIIK